MFCWLDAEAKSSKNDSLRKKLEGVVDNLKTFDKVIICDRFIRDNSSEQINLIVSGSFGREIIPQIHDCPQLIGFYVYCGDRKLNEEWANPYLKNRAVCTKVSELITAIQSEKETGFLTIIKDTTKKAQTSQNAKSLWFQLFIDVLIRTQHKPRDLEDLIEYCRKKCTNNADDLKFIDQFEEKYQPAKAITWYTSDTCLHKIMNKALRLQDFEALYMFRCFITDVAKELQELYQNYMRNHLTRQPMTLYRGQSIGLPELESLKNSIGEFVSMNSFLSTSREREKALSFIKGLTKQNHTRDILFEIQINPSSRTKAFADISHLSEFSNEKEVLIMVGALFHVKEVFEDKQNQLWIARVNLTNEDKFALQPLLENMKQTIGTETNGNSLAIILLHMDEYKQSKTCYRLLQRDNELDKADNLMGMGCVSIRENDGNSIKNLMDSLEIRKKLLSDRHPSVGENYSYLGEAYRKMNDYEQAEKYLKKACEIQERAKRKNPLALADTYNRLGKIYTKTKKYDDAEKYLRKVFSLREKELPGNHPQISGVYANLGWLCECRGETKLALDYYQRSLDIALMTLPSNHPLVHNPQMNIQRIKSKLK